MDFSEALRLLKTTKVSLRRESWSGRKHIRLVKTEGMLPFIGIHTKDGKLGVYTSTNCDILADDWMIYKEEVNTISGIDNERTNMTAVPKYNNDIKYITT